MTQQRFNQLIQICHRCKPWSQTQRKGGCAGPCSCHADGRDIIDHATSGHCPAGFYPDGNTIDALNALPPVVIGEPWDKANAKGGPGTELKKMLAKVGIVAGPTCYCNAMAAQMDANPPAWSLENIDAIVDMMRSEAAKRKLPFVSAVARAMVRRATRKASSPPTPPPSPSSRPARPQG